MEMYDTIIIGSGPAGFTAGIYAARREMKALIIGKEMGGQVMWASEIENYPGFEKIANYDLISKMQQQVSKLGVEIKNGEIKRIEQNNSKEFTIYTNKDEFKAKTVILCIGLLPRRLAIPGEQEFQGKGVSYCANCDAPFHKDKDVVVVGGGNSALDAAEVLSKIAKQVYLIHRRQEFRGFEALVEEVKARPNIELVLDGKVSEIGGSKNVEWVDVLNMKNGETRRIKSQGVFIEVGRIANTDLVKGMLKLDEAGQIVVDDYCATTCQGIFAAGDVTQVPFKQITIACGQATIAALAAYQYLQTS